MNGMPRLILVLTLIAAGAGLVLVPGRSRRPVNRSPNSAACETLRALRAVLPPFDNTPDEDTVQLVIGQDKRGRESCGHSSAAGSDGAAERHRLQGCRSRRLQRQYRGDGRC